MTRRTTAALGAALLGAAALAMPGTALASGSHAGADPDHHGHYGTPGALPGGYTNLVVIYEENHSFDNLYGCMGARGRRPCRRAPVRASGHTGRPGRHAIPLPAPERRQPRHAAARPDTCQDPGHGVAASNFTNRTVHHRRLHRDRPTPRVPPEGVFKPTGVVNGTGLPGGCTRDQVHRFYQEQYQIDGGKQDRYVTGSDAVGLTMGRYDTKALPIYRYLHSRGAPNYVVADHFFQAAFGGSFLNHQFLIAARAPLDTSGGALGARNSVLDSNGMVTKYPLYTPTGTVVDGQLTQKCAAGGNDPVAACGDYAVNTVQPSSAPLGQRRQDPAHRRRGVPEHR